VCIHKVYSMYNSLSMKRHMLSDENGFLEVWLALCKLGKAKPVSSQWMHSSGILQLSYFTKYINIRNDQCTNEQHYNLHKFKFKVLVIYELSDFHEKYQALMCRWLSTHVPHPEEREINVDQEPKPRMICKDDSRTM
jgi:hypothetical protein